MVRACRAPAKLIMRTWFALAVAMPLLDVVCGSLSRGALELYPPTVSVVHAFVDNFDLANDARFDQKVLYFWKWWNLGGPIFLYLGNEGPIEDFYNATGAIFEYAQAEGAAVAFVEHRFYGSTQPYGASPTLKQLRALTVEQAMADYAWYIRGLWDRLGCSTGECPVVTFGGSYGGMLVAWFRQKYPQLTVGGIAASAPVDFYPNDGRQLAFWNATLHTFEKYGAQGCAKDLDTALSFLRAAAETVSGRELLSKTLGSCDDLATEDTAGDKAEFFVRGVAASLAMLDYSENSTFVTPLPANPVSVACKHLRDAGSGHELGGLRNVVDLYLNGTGAFRCYDILAEIVGRPTSGSLRGPPAPPAMGPWQYQVCNELPMEPLASDGFGFYVPSDAQLRDVASACRLRYGLTPRTDWLQLSLGGSDLRVGGLLFTDGEKDPWRAGAVKTQRLPPGIDIVHVVIEGSAHHEDLRFDAVPARPHVRAAKDLALRSIRRWLGRAKAEPVLV